MDDQLNDVKFNTINTWLAYLELPQFQWPNCRREVIFLPYGDNWRVKSHLKQTQSLWLKLENTAQWKHHTHTKSTLISRMERTISQACNPMLQKSANSVLRYFLHNGMAPSYLFLQQPSTTTLPNNKIRGKQYSQKRKRGFLKSVTRKGFLFCFEDQKKKQNVFIIIPSIKRKYTPGNKNC